MTRRSQRVECPQCGNRVARRGGGMLVPHYQGPGGRLRWDNERRCPGGFDPHDDGLVVPVLPAVTTHAPPPPSEGERSVRTVRGGLPSLGRRR